MNTTTTPKNTALRALLAVPLAFGLLLTGCSADPDTKPAPTASEQPSVQTFTGTTVQDAMEAAGFTWLAPDRPTTLAEWTAGVTDYGVLLAEATDDQVAVKWAEGSFLLTRLDDRYFLGLRDAGEPTPVPEPTQAVQEFGSPDSPFMEALAEAGAVWSDGVPVASKEEFDRLAGVDGVELWNADAGDVRIVFAGGELDLSFGDGRFYLK